jgi:hypothetical protein
MTVIPPGRIGDRFVAIFMTVTLVLFAALVALVIYLVTQVSAAENAAHASDIRQCQLANATRVQDIAIWNRLLDVPAKTPAAKTEIADLEYLVKVKDTPRNCASAYSGRQAAS